MIHFCQSLSRPHGHGEAGRKNPNDPIRNRTRDLPASSAMPQPTIPARIQIRGSQNCYETQHEQQYTVHMLHLKLTIFPVKGRSV